MKYYVDYQHSKFKKFDILFHSKILKQVYFYPIDLIFNEFYKKYNF